MIRENDPRVRAGAEALCRAWWGDDKKLDDLDDHDERNAWKDSQVVVDALDKLEKRATVDEMLGLSALVHHEAEQARLQSIGIRPTGDTAATIALRKILRDRGVL